MPTKAIPAGTCNFALNMPREVRLLLGGQAYAENTSTAQFMWKLIEAGALQEAPELAQRIRQARRGIAKVMCALALLLSVGQQILQRDDAAVKASGRVSVLRGVRGVRKQGSDNGAINVEVA